MLKVLLLDCAKSLEDTLKRQGFDLESGTAGYCTGVRNLPSQVYEKDVFIYDPDKYLGRDQILDRSPQYNLDYLESRIKSGAVFVAFVNRLADVVERQNRLYQWIPFMPPIKFTSDKIVRANPFSEYPDNQINYLAPIVATSNLSYPVEQRLEPPEPAPYRYDVTSLFWNGLGHCLGVRMLCGRGLLIALPKFRSNEDVVEAFMHRVIPRIYANPSRGKLTELFNSPAESAAEKELSRLIDLEKSVRENQALARVALATATRDKINLIKADTTAQQVQLYFDHALREGDAALYYLYKIIESIENKFGGETAAIKAVGENTAWKSVKRLANESYRDARHAPKVGDVIKKWTEEELRACFADTKKVIAAYFSTLFHTESN